MFIQCGAACQVKSERRRAETTGTEGAEETGTEEAEETGTEEAEETG
jgi:hypothetical protein